MLRWFKKKEPEKKDIEKPKKGIFARLKERLKKTRENLTSSIDRLMLGKKEIDDEVLEELEETLIMADLGVEATKTLLEQLTKKVSRKEIKNLEQLKKHLKDQMLSLLTFEAPPLDINSTKPFVFMVVGVNGVGKTTTIGKLAHYYKKQGKKVLMIAADTFRAAAIEQLDIWAQKAEVEIYKQQSGADPAAVVFDGLQMAKKRNIDIVLIDTAGRLHTKTNLMEELKKIKRVIQKIIPTAPHEVLLILDATTGQNAISQTKLFHEALKVTGLILAKLDGTAKGGIVISICHQFKIPLRFIGIGEEITALQPFHPEEFVEAIF